MSDDPGDRWIDAIPEDPYAPCPCGCGKKFRFAVKEGIEKHEARFIANCISSEIDAAELRVQDR